MTSAAKIGSFMMVGLVILAAFILKIEDIHLGDSGERLTVQAVFPTVAGVDRRAAVRIAGVRVGKVEEIRLDGNQALLTLSLEPDVRLHEGATAQVTNLGMLGDKYVEIIPGDPAAPLLAAGTTLNGVAPPSFDDVLRVATSIGDDVKQVTEALRTSLGGEQGADKITEIVDNIRDLTASLKQLIAENQSNVNQTTANFQAFSQTLRDELPKIVDKINLLADQLTGVVGDNRDNLQASLANIRDLSNRLKVSADNLNAITTKVANGEGSIGKLVNDSTTVDTFNSTLESVQDGVETLKNTVGRIERFRLDMTMYGETLPEIDETRSSFGFDLWTNDTRFFRVALVNTPFGHRSSETQTVTTDWDDGRSESYTTTKVKLEDKQSFDAQVGYRLLPNTQVRAGLFESQGGIGIDQTLTVGQRALRLSFEAFDFDRDEDSSPHMRLEGRYFVGKNLFVSLGWDDPTYREHSSYLLGAGVTWTDDDVKYLLGLASSGF